MLEKIYTTRAATLNTSENVSRDLPATSHEVERACLSAGKYMDVLRQTFGRRENFSRLLNSVEEFVRVKGIGSKGLEILKDHLPWGTIYVEFSSKIMEEITQLVRSLLAASKEVVREGEKSIAWTKWKGSIKGKVEILLMKLYEDSIREEPRVALIFEIGYRKFVGEVAEDVWKEMENPEIVNIKKMILERFSEEISSLLRTVRNRLCGRYGFDTQIQEKVLDRSSIFGMELRKATFESFAFHLREYNLTPKLVEGLFSVFYGESISQAEEQIITNLKTKTFTKLDDIIKSFQNQLPYVSERAPADVRSLVMKKAKDVENSLDKELSEVRTYIQKVRKQTQDSITKSIDEVKNTITQGFSSDSVIGLSEKVMDSLVSLEKTISGQITYLQDLERKEKSLKGNLDKAKEIGKISLEEVTKTMLKEEGKTPGFLYEHLLRFYELRQTLSGEFSRIWERKPREIASCIKDEIQRHSLEINAAKKMLERFKGKEESSPKERRELEERIKQNELDISLLSELENVRGLTRAYAVEQVVTGYVQFMNNVVEHFAMGKILEDMVRVWNPKRKGDTWVEERLQLEEAKYVSLEMAEKGLLYMFSDEGKKGGISDSVHRKEEIGERISRTFSRTATVMVYDIRGSTFMGAKLHNADKEKEIKNKFSSIMANIAKRAGAFLLKDTGDGGIFWFSDNSRDVYEKIYREISIGKSLRIRHSTGSKGDIGIVMSTDSARKAIEAAVEMVAAAERFIEENYSHYREWFKEAKEKEILYEGIPYAVLPPEFRSLFRIGVGLASGKPGKDIAFGLNAFGDPDLGGISVSEAHLYAGERDPLSSVIIADSHTVFNLLLNIEHVDEKESGLFLESLGVSVKRIGYHLAPKEEIPKKEGLSFKDKDEKILVNETGVLYDENKSSIKILYEIVPKQEKIQEIKGRAVL